MLADLDRERRQLRHLVTSGRTARPLLIRAEDVAAAAALRPVLDHLAHPLDRKQRPPMPNMARLAAPLSPRPPRPPPLCRPRRILARRQRRVMRVALQPLLELSNTLGELCQLGVLCFHSRRQRQQHLDHRLAPLRVDRLRLRALHTAFIRRPGAGPCRLTHTSPPEGSKTGSTRGRSGLGRD